jgi:hypothetical protein
MNKSTRLLITAAAVAGLYAGASATRAFAANAKSGQAGQMADKDGKAKAGCGAHACAGKNGCAGKGGCKTSDKGCKAKNSCAGKGGCAVADAKKDAKAESKKA